MTNKKAFYLFQDLEEVVKQLTDKHAGQLFKAIFQYARGETPSLSSTLSLIFIPIKQSLDRNRENFEKVSRINSNNAKQRWTEAKNETNLSDRMQSHPNAYKTDTDIDTDNHAVGLLKSISSKEIQEIGKSTDFAEDLVRFILEKELIPQYEKNNRPIHNVTALLNAAIRTYQKNNPQYRRYGVTRESVEEAQKKPWFMNTLDPRYFSEEAEQLREENFRARLANNL